MDRVLVPDSLRAELANVVWTVHRAGLVSLTDALGVLEDAESALVSGWPHIPIVSKERVGSPET